MINNSSFTVYKKQSIINTAITVTGKWQNKDTNSLRGRKAEEV